MTATMSDGERVDPQVIPMDKVSLLKGHRNGRFSLYVSDEVPCARQLLEVYDQHGASVAGLKRMPEESIVNFGVVGDTWEESGRILGISGFVADVLPGSSLSPGGISGVYCGGTAFDIGLPESLRAM